MIPNMIPVRKADRWLRLLMFGDRAVMAVDRIRKMSHAVYLRLSVMVIFLPFSVRVM